ncbi:clcC [Symbiodinium pilosum]|uniref:ClcC protein n=1 Tax=Symbiodinium pilosum TaxID=2952 RepID=A0A812IZ13_SYMPI|nr:clcC [Symbiodinium pilosum]
MGCGASSEQYRENNWDAEKEPETAEAHGSVDYALPGDAATYATSVDCASVRQDPAPSQRASSASGAWQVEASGAWETLPPDVNQALTEAYHSGQTVALYSVRGARPSDDASFDVDFRSLVQTNRKTGQVLQIRWDACASAGNCQAAGQGGRTRYQWELKDGEWADFEEEEEQYIVRAWMMGHDFIRYAAWGLEYEINFPRMVLINISSGNRRHIRVKPAGSLMPAPSKTAPPEAAEEPAEQPRAEPAPNSKPEARRAGRPQDSSKRFSLGKKTAQGAQPAPDAKPGHDPKREAKPGPQPERPERYSQELPSGASWPPLPSAREAARVLFAELCATRQRPTAEKKSFYKGHCLAWHPDKNLDQEELATEVFKFLQLVRDWYLVA